MKYFCIFVLGTTLRIGQASLFAGAGSPVQKVVELLTNIKGKIEREGEAEQAEYDKYACWVESTLARKAKNINDAETLNKELQAKIEKLTGEVAAGGAEIASLQKLIAENEETTKETAGSCDTARAEYAQTTQETENAMGALEQAIKAIQGAGTGKKSFLAGLQEAQLISAAASIRTVIQKPVIQSAASDADMEVINKFLSTPEEFAKKGTSALQVTQNPFGDYAPKSNVINGIFKGLYDGMAQSMEKANAEQGDKEKSCQELLATKAKELKTMTETLNSHIETKGAQEVELADADELQADTTKQLDADEQFFAETKENGQKQAKVWSYRVQSRTSELRDIGEATRILKEGEATFAASNKNLLQVSFIELSNVQQTSTKDFTEKLFKIINKMIKDLVREGDDDDHRKSVCLEQATNNGIARDDAKHHIDTTQATMDRLDREISDNIADKDTKVQEIKDQKADIAAALAERNEEQETFRRELKEDAQAVQILQKARGVLANSQTHGALLQKRKAKEPEYQQKTQDDAPELSFGKDGSYGTSGETGGVLGMMDMLIDDLKMEIKTTTQKEKDDQAAYAREAAAAQKVLENLHKVAAKLDRERQVAQENRDQQESSNDAGKKELKALQDQKTIIDNECAWVHDGTFEQRREAREGEIAGLEDAKVNLSGAVTK